MTSYSHAYGGLHVGQPLYSMNILAFFPKNQIRPSGDNGKNMIEVFAEQSQVGLLVCVGRRNTLTINTKFKGIPFFLFYKTSQPDNQSIGLTIAPSKSYTKHSLLRTMILLGAVFSSG